MQKKILVTGGAGFVGSHLCKTLSKDKNNLVYSLDNYSSGSKENHVPGVEYFDGHTKDIDKLIKFSPDIVYHLGEYSRVERSFYDYDEVFLSNVCGTGEVLKFCRKHNCKIVYAGSSTKFGDNGLSATQTPYGWSKFSNTILVNSFSNWYNIPYAITYFYNVYGENELSTGKYATLIGIFSEQFRSGKNLTVVYPGVQKRNFTHVEDIISGLILVGEKGLGDNFGIGSCESYSVLEIAEMFGKDIEFLPERRGNRLTSDVVTDRTKDLGWEPKHSIVDYISQIVQRQADDADI